MAHIVLFGVCFYFTLGSAHAGVVTLVGSGHEVGVESLQKAQCPKLHEDLYRIVKSRVAYDRSFVFMTESPIPRAWQNESIKYLEDENLHAYLALFLNAKRFFTGIRQAVETKDPKWTTYNIEQARTLKDTFLNSMFWNERARLMAPDVQNILKLKNESQRNEFLALMNRSPQAYEKSSFYPVINIHQKSLRDLSLGQVKEVLSKLNHWKAFVSEVGKSYFERMLKSNKYNILIDNPKSQYHNKRIYELADPGKLFSTIDQWPYREDDYFSTVVTSWRSYFFYKNIVEVAKARPTQNILVWMGADHVGQVAKLFYDSWPIDGIEIQVLGEHEQRGLVCNTDYVFGHLSKVDPPNELSTWYEKYHSK